MRTIVLTEKEYATTMACLHQGYLHVADYATSIEHCDGFVISSVMPTHRRLISQANAFEKIHSKFFEIGRT